MITWKFTWLENGIAKSISIQGSLHTALSIAQSKGAWDHNLISIERVAEVQS